MISAFINWLFACAQATASDTDQIGELPVEVSSTIFRYLDGESLLAAASVNHRWNTVCKSDAVLRRKIRQRLRRERKERIEAYMKPSKTIRIIRSHDVPAVQFGMRNGNVPIENLPVRYEAPKPVKKNTQTKQFKISINSDGKNLTRTSLKTKKNKINVSNNNCNIKTLRM